MRFQKTHMWHILTYLHSKKYQEKMSLYKYNINKCTSLLLFHSLYTSEIYIQGYLGPCSPPYTSQPFTCCSHGFHRDIDLISPSIRFHFFFFFFDYHKLATYLQVLKSELSDSWYTLCTQLLSYMPSRKLKHNPFLSLLETNIK